MLACGLPRVIEISSVTAILDRVLEHILLVNALLPQVGIV